MYVKLYNKLKEYPWVVNLYNKTVIRKLYHLVIAVNDFVSYKTKALFQYLSSLPRALGCNDKRFVPLRKLKKKYKGKRCFVICTGPSLTIADLELLKDEYVFGMNSTAMIFDKTTWRPDFYGIQDGAVYERIKEAVANPENGMVFVPYSFKKRYGTPDNWFYFHCCGAYHLFECYQLEKYYSKFSKDSYVRVYDGFTITYSILQLAYYMGFDEIYLLGADCTYMGKKKHFIEHGNNPSNLDIATDRLTASYMCANKFAQKHNLKIFNATRGGMLEVFPRVSLEEILESKKKNKIY